MLLILIFFCLTSSSPGTKLSWKIKLQLNQILKHPLPPLHPHPHPYRSTLLFHKSTRYLQQESADFGTAKCINHPERRVARRNKLGWYKGLYGTQRYCFSHGYSARPSTPHPPVIVNLCEHWVFSDPKTSPIGCASPRRHQPWMRLRWNPCNLR